MNRFNRRRVIKILVTRDFSIYIERENKSLLKGVSTNIETRVDVNMERDVFNARSMWVFSFSEDYQREFCSQKYWTDTRSTVINDTGIDRCNYIENDS